MRAGQVMSAIVTITTAVCIAFIYGWKLALVLVLAVPFIIGAGYQQQMSLRKYQRRDAKFMDEAGRVIHFMIIRICGTLAVAVFDKRHARAL